MKIKKLHDQINIIDFISVILIIFCSNTVVFHQVYGRVTTPIFFIYALIVFFLKKKSFSIYNIKVIVVFMAIFGLSTIANINSFSFSNDTIIMFLFLFGTLLLSESMTFRAFKTNYLLIIMIMATYSLVIFILYESGVIGSTYLTVRDAIYVMCMGENMGWYIDYHRIAGPFWEGGAYQIFLNIALLLKYNDLYDKKLERRDLMQLVLLYFVIFLTKSTAGCIILALITVICLPKVNIGFLNKKSKLVIFSIVSITLVVALLSSGTVVNKFSLNNLSYVRRSSDLLNSISLIAQHPLFGTGYYSELASQNIGTNSSGILEIMVYFGVLMLVFYCIQFYKTLKQYPFKFKTIQLLLILIALNTTECVYTLPIMFVFLFKFAGKEKTIIKRRIPR